MKKNPKKLGKKQQGIRETYLRVDVLTSVFPSSKNIKHFHEITVFRLEGCLPLPSLGLKFLNDERDIGKQMR